jgi:hypothetical protein
LGGKATILGFGGVLPYVQIGVASLPAKLDSLTLLLLLKGAGSIPATLALVNPDGSLTDSNKPIDVVLKWDNESQVIGASLGLNDFVAQGEGRYTIRLSVDGSVAYESSFEIGLSNK